MAGRYFRITEGISSHPALNFDLILPIIDFLWACWIDISTCCWIDISSPVCRSTKQVINAVPCFSNILSKTVELFCKIIFLFVVNTAEIKISVPIICIFRSSIFSNYISFIKFVFLME